MFLSRHLLLAFASIVLATTGHSVTVCAQSLQRVAVLEPRDESNASAAVLAEISDLLRGGAAAVLPDTVVVMTRENTLQLLPPDRTLAECSDAACEVEAGRLLGADVVISAVLRRVESTYRLTVSAHDTATADLIGTQRASASSGAALVEEVENDAEIWMRSWFGNSPQSPNVALGSRSAPQPSPNGAIEVFATNPSVLDILLDGRSIGTSGTQIILVPGRYRLQLRAPGFRPVFRDVTVLPNQVTAIADIQLHTIPATVVVESSVAGVTVSVDGVPQGQTGIGQGLWLEVAPGVRVIQVSRPGYRSAERSVNLLPGSSETIQFQPQVMASRPPPTAPPVPAAAPRSTSRASRPDPSTPRNPFGGGYPYLSVGLGGHFPLNASGELYDSEVRDSFRLRIEAGWDISFLQIGLFAGGHGGVQSGGVNPDGWQDFELSSGYTLGGLGYDATSNAVDAGLALRPLLHFPVAEHQVVLLSLSVYGGYTAQWLNFRLDEDSDSESRLMGTYEGFMVGASGGFGFRTPAVGVRFDAGIEQRIYSSATVRAWTGRGADRERTFFSEDDGNFRTIGVVSMLSVDWFISRELRKGSVASGRPGRSR